MKEYTESDPVVRKYRTGHTVSSFHDDSSELSINFTLIFKQLFCVAAHQLANILHEPLERLGVLFEEPLDTDAIYISTQTGGISSRPYQSPQAKTGAAPQVLARGKYLFLTRGLSKCEASKFATLGYRFATVGQIAEPLARNMRVDSHGIVSRLERMKLSASADHLPPPGVHLVCFMVRPSMYKSFDILVPTAIQSQLPLSTIQSRALSQDQLEQLQRFDDLTINEILRILVNQSSGPELNEEFRWQLYDSFVKLVDVIGDPHTIMHGKFSAKTFQVPCRSTTNPNSLATCTLLTVRLLRSIHTASVKNDLAYVPLPFFSAQQQAWSGNPDETFIRKLKPEFCHLLPSSSVVHNIARRASSADTIVDDSESRSRLSKALIGKFYPRHKSDEASIVDSGKSMNESTDVEMTVVTSNGTTLYQKGSWVAQADITDLTSAGGDKSIWVTEAFNLFRLEPTGWSSRRPGWNWDINVENSFEVGTKDRDTEDLRQQKMEF